MTDQEIKSMRRRDLQIALRDAAVAFDRCCNRLRRMDRYTFDLMVTSKLDIEKIKTELASKREEKWD